jgi:hypothetical protein
MKKNVVLYNNFQEPKLGGRKIEDLEILKRKKTPWSQKQVVLATSLSRSGG